MKYCDYLKTERNLEITPLSDLTAFKELEIKPFILKGDYDTLIINCINIDYIHAQAIKEILYATHMNKEVIFKLKKRGNLKKTFKDYGFDKFFKIKYV